jgi:hypothetical protein
MEIKNIDYIPGCAELGDFDATSTTIGVNPGGELGRIPEPQLTATFDRYFQFFRDRRDGREGWRDYTPYELRTIGTFVFLGQRERAHEALAFFLNDQRPAGWNHWAEVVWKDPTTPRFIGDMPHTWVGSDFLRSIRSMFVYEREQDTTLVFGAGLDPRWLDDPGGVEIGNLPTYFGNVGMSLHRTGDTVHVRLDGRLARKPASIVLVSPLRVPLRSARVDDAPVLPGPNGDILLDHIPAVLTLTY